MTAFTTIRNHGKSAFVMLLVWTFALVSGVANACLLDGSATRARAGTPTQTTHDDRKHGSVVGHLQAEAGPDQDDDSHASREPCLKVCDDGSRSLPKQCSSSHIDPGPPIVVAVLWTAVAPIDLQRHQASDAPRVISTLPLRVRYSRLAL